MRFMMVYSNQFSSGNKPNGIASIAAMLKNAGHTFELFDCTKYNMAGESGSNSNSVGEDNLRFKIPTNKERLPERIRINYEGLSQELFKSIDAFKPDIIGLSVLTDDYPLGLGLMQQVKHTFPNITTIAGGVHPAVDPNGVISESCFDMICVGEGEYVVLDIGERIDQKQGFEGIANLWVKRSDGSIQKNPVRPYETNLDLFPFPDWSIYPETSFYKPYLGWVYKYGDFEMSRGCPYKCSYCINVHLQEVYKGYQYHREKSIPRVIEEIKYALDNYNIEFLKFWDETFLLMSKQRMEEFADIYPREIGLPYVIETTSQSINDFSVKILQKTDCRSASLGMETGNPDIRMGLLNKPTENAAYLKAYKLMGEHGIQKASFNMIGLPNESQEDVFRSIGLNRLVKTDVVSAATFYPYKGTPIREWMVREGWMGEDFDLAHLVDYDFSTFVAGKDSVVRFKDMDTRMLNRLWRTFSVYALWPIKLYPLIDHIKNNDGEFVDSLFANIRRVSYQIKFGEAPPILEGTEQDLTGGTDRTNKYPSPPLDLGDAEAEKFAKLLMETWTGSGYDAMISMLQAISSGTLNPEFPIPSDDESLISWLEIDLSDESILRDTRKDMRDIAKAYAAANIIEISPA